MLVSHGPKVASRFNELGESSFKNHILQAIKADVYLRLVMMRSGIIVFTKGLRLALISLAWLPLTILMTIVFWIARSNSHPLS